MNADNKVLELLNEQMNFEFYSAYIYLGMASYCSSVGYKGFENWFKVQYKEEVDHAMKFFDFINSRGGKATIDGIGKVQTDYENILEMLKTGLKHEEHVSSKIHSIAKAALESADLTSFSFIQWFIDEQVEEEENFNDIITDVTRASESGLYLVDKDLATRVYTPLVVN